MLKASAQSPAMLHYLDNRLSKGDDPNENYARELLELHTVGVDGGYTEEDVRNASYCLTGWTTKDHQFEFRDRWHYSGPLKILKWRTDGMSSPEAIQDGISFLDYLAHRCKTAKFLAEKLCRRFIDGNPPKGEIVSARLANPLLGEVFLNYTPTPLGVTTAASAVIASSLPSTTPNLAETPVQDNQVFMPFVFNFCKN